MRTSTVGVLRQARQILTNPPRPRDIVPTTTGKPIVTLPLLSHRTTRPFSDVESMGKKEKLSYQLKTPKGTKDYTGADLQLRNDIFDTIRTVFRRHGAQELDTPVFELTEVLRGNYGEDSKLIYDLQDQGGELCSLRYDLTVPFARWLALNPDVKNYDRYAIGKVYRRDQPAMGKGRMREFYQCDFDMAGAGSDPMISDAEILRIVVEVFEGLGWKGRYTIKLNHRQILDGVFEVCGVPAEKTRTISSAVDKLDKAPWSEVRREMVEEKGLDGAVADQIQAYVMLKGGKDLLEKLRADEKLSKSDGAKAGMEDMRLLLDYLEVFDVLDHVSFDMSLARGLDYYTGLIYEVITDGSAPEQVNGAEQGHSTHKPSKKTKKAADDDDRSDDPTVGVGSVAAGGRYDKLVNKFLPNADMPCVGISFGIERIFAIEKARRKGQSHASEADVWIIAMGDGLIIPRLKIATDLWDAGIRAQYTRKLKARFDKQFAAAEKARVPFAVIVGEGELQSGEVRIKEMGLPDGHPAKEGLKVKLHDLATEVKRRLAMKAENIGEVAEIVGGTTKMSVEDGGEAQTTEASRKGGEL